MSATATIATLPRTDFTLPPGAEATEPPERRGMARDEVHLLVVGPEDLQHRRFRDLSEVLAPGDLLVVNTSATLPAALDARLPDGRPAPVHLSGRLDDGAWVVEVRRADGTGPDLDRVPGDRLRLPAGVALHLGASYPRAGAEGSRLWQARAEPAVEPLSYLARHGRPVEYGYLAPPGAERRRSSEARFPLADYQTVYATQPGSAEMPSAGRPFTAQLLVRLMARGVTVAPVVLHTGVSSPELHEPPVPERFEVPPATARLVTGARASGRRVVAVGTTVVRALETATGADGTVHPARGWTDLVLGPDHPVRSVTGLVTGLHPPRASHLLLLEAVAGPGLVARAYAAAVATGYRWHEFGDSMLFLP